MEKCCDFSISHFLYSCGFSTGYASVLCTEQTDRYTRAFKVGVSNMELKFNTTHFK